jgi:hypothetical protein
VPLNCRAANVFRWVPNGILAASIILFSQHYAVAAGPAECTPAVEATVGTGVGLISFPGTTPLSIYALTEVQGSECGFSVGASSSRGLRGFDQRVFGSYTYTLGYLDLSAGLMLDEFKSSRQYPGVIGQNYVFISSAFHPTRHSEISAQWGRDVIHGGWTVRTDGIDRLWTSPGLALYGYLGFERAKEDERGIFGGNLINVGVRVRRKINNALSMYADFGAAHTWATGNSGSKQSGVFLIGVTYRHGYHDSDDIGHLGIRDH